MSALATAGAYTRAKPGCPDGSLGPVNRRIQSFPIAWRLPPMTGERYPDLDAFEARVRAWSFCEGFDTVCFGGGTQAAPGRRLRCIHHGTETRNYRQLEPTVEYTSLMVKLLPQGVSATVLLVSYLAFGLFVVPTSLLGNAAQASRALSLLLTRWIIAMSFVTTLLPISAIESHSTNTETRSLQPVRTARRLYRSQRPGES